MTGHVGPYRLVRRLGSGGMGSVFAAEDGRLGQHVALKQLHEHLEARPGARARFLREGQAAAKIRHPNVVQVFALGDDSEGRAYLAMELLEGNDLGAILSAEGKLDLGAALAWLLPAMAGVAAAHDAGVVHRDLKPSNIFITRLAHGQTCPKVVDFGVSKLQALQGTELTASGMVVGTAAYMAPEQARSPRAASPLSDQYSLGVILYECITGVLPFRGESVLEVLQAIMTAPVAPASQLAPALPEGIDAVVQRAMSREPAQRFASVRALGAALLPFAREDTRAALAAEFANVEVRAARTLTLVPSAQSVALGATEASPSVADRRRRQQRGRMKWVSVGVACLAILSIALAYPTDPPVSSSEPARASTPPSNALGATLSESPTPAPPAPAREPAPVAHSLEPHAPLAARPTRPGHRLREKAAQKAAAPVARPAAEPVVVLGTNGAPILPP